MLLNKLILSFEDISVLSRAQTVFSHLSFQIKQGEHWLLLGNHERGINTLLETIAGKTFISRGKSDYAFHDTFKRQNSELEPLAGWQKPVSLVSARHSFRNLCNTQDFYYQQRYNATESDDAPSLAQHLSAIKPFSDHPYWTFDKTVAALGLEALLEKTLIKLSNGETRKVLLAEALLQNPALLLLENPFAGLDAEARQSLNQLLTSISLSGITLVMTGAATPIPDAVTHIAHFNENEPFKTFSKEAYQQQEVPAKVQEPIDKDISTLLPAKPEAAFKILVGMEDVSVRYDDKTILDGINLTIGTGERLALIGHNGAGKSTLLSLIYGDNPQAYANKITLFDRRRGSGESIWEIKSRIGFVSPELFQYFPARQSCGEVVESGFYDTLGLFKAQTAEKSAAALRWMRVLGIDDIHAEQFQHVSASKQRLCLLARALVKNPALLILDEPCHGFDESQLLNFKYLINTLCQGSNLSLIYVSHYAHEIPECITKTVRLEKGKIVNQGL